MQLVYFQEKTCEESYLFYYQIPAKVVIFRKKNEGVIDTEKEVMNRLRAANIPYE
jgi:hypothetical protein